MVPDRCEAFGDCRIVSVRPEDIRRYLENCLQNVKGNIEDLIKVPPAVVPPDNPYVVLFHQTV